MSSKRPATKSASKAAAFSIVGVGASAGGLAAFKTFFNAMPADAGLAYVLIQHLDPNQKSLMVELLSKCTDMPLVLAEDGLRVEPDHVYMIPPNRYMTLEKGVLRLFEFGERRALPMAIDTFLCSLAQDQNERAIGVILTGTGTDGTAGLKEIKAHGGLALVQEPDTAAHDGMPRSAIATGLADLVCPIEQMTEVLFHYADHPYVNGTHQQTNAGTTSDKLNLVLALLRARRGVDFRHDKSNTPGRRIERRMSINRRLDDPSLQRLQTSDTSADPISHGRHDRVAQSQRLADMVQRWVLAEYAPATVIVNRRFESLFFFGETERYLTIPHGESNLNLLEIVREGLATPVRGAVHRALERNVAVDIKQARMRQQSRYLAVSIQVKPLKGMASDGEGLAMVSFRELSIPASATRGNACPATEEEALVNQLEDELKATREDLHSTIEDMDTSNEELKASNEEVMSMNEELQSANEELETSKEELQTLNEELITVNSQLQEKLVELEAANNDVINFVNSSELAILFLDIELQIKRFTPSTKRLFNLIPADCGRPLVDIAQLFDDPDLLDDARQVLDRLTVSERNVQDQAGNWYDRRVLPYRTHGNKIDGVVVLFNDITRLRSSERLASERLAQLEAIYDQTPIGLAFHDPQLRMQRLNARLAALNGAAVEDLVGKRPDEFLPPTLAHEVETMLHRVLQTDTAAIDIELHSDLASEPGLQRDWLISYYPVHAKSGELLGVNVVVMEVTAQKQTERRLAASREVAQVLSNARSLDAAIPQVLAAFAEHFGANICEYWQRSADGLRCSEFRVPGASTERQDDLQKLFDETLLQPGDSLVGQVWLQQRPRWIVDVKSDPDFERSPAATILGLTTGFAFPVVSGKTVIGVMSFFMQDRLPIDATLIQAMTTLGCDIGNFSRRMRAEDKLRDSDRRKEGFLTVLGHELRNPLASISNALRLLQQDTDERDWALTTMANNVVTMSRLLDDLLDLSRIKSGKIVLRQQPVAVAALVEQVLAGVRGQIDDKQQRLAVELPPAALTLNGDPVRLEQVLINLLINASKFTPAGGEITLTVSRDDSWAVITISDTGAGISAEYLTFIFEPLAQLDAARRQNSGLGIGLALVKQLTKLHGGTISAASDGLGQGASFTLRLPLMTAPSHASDGSPAPARTVTTNDTAAAAKPRVLLVDDNEPATQGLSLLLRAWGYAVATALDGTSALEIAAAQQPQALILDLSLPDMSGYELARRLRSNGFDQALLIALSGFGDTAAKAEARQAGFDHHLSKPADLNALQRLLEGVE